MFKQVDTAVVVSRSNCSQGVLNKNSCLSRARCAAWVEAYAHMPAKWHCLVLCFRALHDILQCAVDFIPCNVDAEVRARVLRVDPLAGKLSLTLRPSAVDGATAKSTADADAVDGGLSDEEADLDEEMAARLDDEVLWFAGFRVYGFVVVPLCSLWMARLDGDVRWRCTSGNDVLRPPLPPVMHYTLDLMAAGHRLKL
jgi:hypothetical protein